MLHLNTFIVREHVGAFKLTDVFDILDPSSGRKVGEAREEPAAWAKWLRLVLGKKFLPTRVVVTGPEEEGAPLFFTIEKPFGFLRHKIVIKDSSGVSPGHMVSKVFTLGGGFHVFDAAGNPFAEVKGDWAGWNFTLETTEGKKLGTVSKKWEGFGRELLTSADSYVVELAPDAPSAPEKRILLLAAALAIDIVFKESD